MGAVRKEIIDVVALLGAATNGLRVKLDAWKCTLIIRNQARNITIDGLDIEAFSRADGLGNVNTIVVPLGGLVVKGMPVQMDDELIVSSINAGLTDADLCFTIIKEFYIADTPGPDHLKPPPNERTRNDRRRPDRPRDAGGQRPQPRDRARVDSYRRER